MAVSRGKVSDGPKISMVVEKGRLVPASAFDFELLNAWREGAIVNVSPVLAQNRPLERRYFAMLSKLIKVAETPWTNTEAAHEAIKLATGFVEPYQRKNGEWAADARHISTFTDTELQEFFELFCGIVRRRFEIDPDTLRKEAPDTGSLPSRSSEASSATAGTDDGPGVDPIPVDAGEPFSSAPPALVEDEPEAGDVSPSSPADGPLTKEDMAWLKTAARMLVAATAVGGGVSEVTVLDRQWAAILRYNTARSVTPQARAIALRIHEYCDAAVVGGGPFERDWIANMAGCKVEDLRPEAR
jgi:hypothetical protein